VQRETADEAMAEAEGLESKEVKVGDLVLIKTDPSVGRAGPLRFQPRVHPNIYRIKRQVQRHTFEIECVHDPSEVINFLQPIHADRIIVLDMPELDLTPDQRRLLEVYNEASDRWVRHRIERFSVDGRVQLRDRDNPTSIEWFDLSKVRYRWVI